MLLFSAIRVVQQYERGVIFILGRLIGAKGPGIFLVPPFITHMTKVDLLILTPTLMRLDSDPCRLNPVYSLDEVT